MSLPLCRRPLTALVSLVAGVALALTLSACGTSGGDGSGVVNLGPTGASGDADASVNDATGGGGSTVTDAGGGGGTGGTGSDAGGGGSETGPDLDVDNSAPRGDSSGPPDGAGVGDDDVAPCEPSCGDAECGPDGCGGSCGSCPAAAPFCDAGLCALEPAAGVPALAFDTAEVNFEVVADGEIPAQTVVLRNEGTAPLEVTELKLLGAGGFQAQIGDEGWLNEGGGAEASFEPPLVVEAEGELEISVRYTGSGDAEGSLVLFTNDPLFPSGASVSLVANLDGACLAVVPSAVVFGGKLVGNKSSLEVDLVSCGSTALKISEVSLVGDSDFELEVPQQPVSLAAGAEMSILVHYTPSEESPLGDDGTPVLSEAQIVVVSDAPGAPHEIEVSGVGVGLECPTAVPIVQEGQAVIPQTKLHLMGDQSYASGGDIATWEWTVTQPAGSASVFTPSASFPNPTFEVNVAGEYVFNLRVWDEDGVESCVPGEVTVLVVPDEAIHIELLWDTPDDPDQTDQGPEAGADLDLHFAHKAYAASGPDLDGDGLPDPWFDQPFDCFWFNSHPNWASFDPSVDDDPGLDRDDTDGAGPENVNLNLPETTDYLIGVHYWNDHEYGPSYATVRIYIYGELMLELADVKMLNHDMWEVGTISWPSGNITVTTVDGGHKITPNYQNPFFFQP